MLNLHAAQDEGEWRRTAEQGAERFMAKWIAMKKVKAGQLACSSMAERDGKDQGENSPKKEGSVKEGYPPTGNMRYKLHVLGMFVSQGMCSVIPAFVYS